MSCGKCDECKCGGDKLDALRQQLQEGSGVVTPLHKRTTGELAVAAAKVFNQLEELQLRKVEESVKAGKINPVLLHNKALANINPSSTTLTKEEQRLVMEESVNNPVYFLYLVRLNTKDVDK